MASPLAGLTTTQMAIGGAAIAGVGLVMLTSGKKKGGAGGGVAVLDVRRPTDDINAIGAGRPGGVIPRLNQVLNIAPIFPGNPAYSGVYPGIPVPPMPPGSTPSPPSGPPGTTVPPTTMPAPGGRNAAISARIAVEKARIQKWRERNKETPGRTQGDERRQRLIQDARRDVGWLQNLRSPKANEGVSIHRPTPPVGGGNGQFLQDKMRGNFPFTFIGGSIIEGDNEGYNLTPAQNTAAITGAAAKIW